MKFLMPIDYYTCVFKDRVINIYFFNPKGGLRSNTHWFLLLFVVSKISVVGWNVLIGDEVKSEILLGEKIF